MKLLFAQSLISYFTDPVLRGPTIGSMLMCFASGLIGVIVYLRKESLVGEALSHTSYPGVALGGLVGSFLVAGVTGEGTGAILLGAFLSSLLGYFAISFLESRMKVRPDGALCFILASFFGIGVTLASRFQFSYPALYRQTQLYLYGQAATMNDEHIYIYAFLVLLALILCFFFYKEILATTLDREYAITLGMKVRTIETFILFLVVFAVVIGIRSVGVVLISAMLIAPSVAARQWTNRLSNMLLIAGIMGLLSGFLGNYFSFEISQYLSQLYPEKRVAVPTGPLIVVLASAFCFFSLLFAPRRGWVMKKWRAAHFRRECTLENLLKAGWRVEGEISYQDLTSHESASEFYLRNMVRKLKREGWLREVSPDTFLLTEEGRRRAAWIVRLHRLWEVYLVDYLGVGAEKVHYSAEEMEHILTPELEKELTDLLNDPTLDPHQSPIPKGRGV